MADENIIEHKTVPAGKIFTYWKTLICSMLIGGTLAVSYMIGKNYEVFNEHKKAREIYLSGLFINIVLSILLILLPGVSGLKYSIPAIVYCLANIHMRSTIYKEGQTDKIFLHIKAGGKTAGWGKTIIISILGMIFSVGIYLSIDFPIQKLMQN